MANLVIWKLCLLAQVVLASLATARCRREREAGRLLQAAGLGAVWLLTVAPVVTIVALWSIVADKYHGNFAKYLRLDHHYLAIVYPGVTLLMMLNILAVLTTAGIGALVAILDFFGGNFRWYWQTVAAFVVCLPAQWFALVYSMIDG